MKFALLLALLIPNISPAANRSAVDLQVLHSMLVSNLFMAVHVESAVGYFGDAPLPEARRAGLCAQLGRLDGALLATNIYLTDRSSSVKIVDAIRREVATERSKVIDDSLKYCDITPVNIPSAELKAEYQSISNTHNSFLEALDKIMK